MQIGRACSYAGSQFRHPRDRGGGQLGGRSDGRSVSRGRVGVRTRGDGEIGGELGKEQQARPFSAGVCDEGGAGVRTHSFDRTSPFHICRVEGCLLSSYWASYRWAGLYRLELLQ
jgi:hypothetical protein